MLPSEPFGPLPPLRLADNAGALYQGGTDDVCTICRVRPYSEEARRFKVNGFIKVEAIVTVDGRLDNARILSGLQGGLNQQTIATFKAGGAIPP